MALSRGGGPGADPLLGDAMAVVAAAWYGGYILVVRRLRGGVSATGVMLWTSAVGAPLLLVAALALGERLAPQTALGWIACLGMGLAHFAGQGAIAWALGRLPAATAAVVILLQPAVAAVLGWMIFAEPLGALQTLGGLAALAGVVVAQLSGVRAETLAAGGSRTT
jgi:drug/metabolite transporter (DMT)-like permease